MTVLATAGHVDHGKSTLVRALTGVDPDRLSEEKARGLTIDLGFASMTLPSGRTLAFVDVPGHVRFLKNMLAGVGGVECCLFVVAATEGWKPQSEEHLRILELLGIRHGIVVLTKAGLADEDDLTLARLDAADRLEGTFLASAEVLAVDSVDGRGLGALRLALDRLLEATPPSADRHRPRLWVDRSFAARGAGTVVTGTLAGGALAVDDEVLVTPGDLTARVRALQSHGHDRPVAPPGTRVAVNLSGVDHGAVTRGAAVVRASQWHRATRVDATLRVLASLGHPVSRRGAYLAYLGSGEHPVKLRVLGSSALGPGEAGLVRLHLPVGLPLLPGDRYVLRESGRSETVGGGEILDIDPVVPASRARPDRSVERVVAERGWIDVARLEQLTGELRAPDVGTWAVAPEALEQAMAGLRERVTAAGPLGLDLALLDDRARAVLDRVDGVVVRQGRAVTARSSDPLADHPYLDALAASPFRPPPPDGIDRSELRELIRRGLMVERGGICFAPSAIEEACRRIAALLAQPPPDPRPAEPRATESATATAPAPGAGEGSGVTEGLSVTEIREALDTTRKYLIPLLEHLDATGRTRRRGDRRIAGPRLLDP